MRPYLTQYSVVALVVGGLVGAALALWYAPQPGRATQAMLHTQQLVWQTRVTYEVQNTVAQVQGALGNLGREAKTTALGFVKSLEKTLNSMGAAVQPRNSVHLLSENSAVDLSPALPAAG
jgi:gas vesicle protein